MKRRILTLALLALPIFPAAGADATASQRSGCAEYGERSVSTGTVRAGAFRIAAYCFTGAVEGTTLRVAGRSVDGATDELCTKATTHYTRRGARGAVEHPLNCAGGTTTLASTVVRDVSSAHIEVCVVEKGTLRSVACSGRNQIHPVVAGKGSGNRR